MPSTDTNLEWIDLTDFSAGVVSHDGAPTPAGDGAASAAKNCVPGPSGGLFPGPRLVQIDTGVAASEDVINQPYNDGRQAILDFCLSPAPWEYGNASASNPSWRAPATDLIATLSHWYGTNTGGPFRESLTLGAGLLAPDGYHQISSNRSVATPNVYAAVQAAIYGYRNALTNRTASTALHGFGSIAAVTLFREATSVVGTQTWVATMQPTSSYSSTTRLVDSAISIGTTPRTEHYNWLFDNPAGWESVAWSLNLPEVAGLNYPRIMFEHQGRAVAGTLTNAYGDGWGQNGATVNDGSLRALQSLRFADKGDVSAAKWTGGLTIQDPIGGVASWASVNSNQLLLIGHTGGGVSITGDIGAEGVAVTRLPLLPSGYGRCTYATPSPAGVIYGTRDGAFTWKGGDTAEPLSQQLPTDFWWPEDGTFDRFEYIQPKGRSAVAWPFLFFPNDWICDLRFGSWFKVGSMDSDHPHPVAHWRRGSDGTMYGMRGWLELNGGTQDWIYRYDVTQGAEHYTWTSAPLSRSHNRILSARELAFVVQAPDSGSEIRITVSSAEGGAPQEIRKSLTASPRPQLIRDQLGLDAGDLILDVEAWNTAGFAAPAIHRISLGYRPTRTGSSS